MYPRFMKETTRISDQTGLKFNKWPKKTQDVVKTIRIWTPNNSSCGVQYPNNITRCEKASMQLIIKRIKSVSINQHQND